MPSVINPHLLKFTLGLQEAVDKLLDEASPDFLTNFYPIDIQLHTIDGYTAHFLEEGIEFYPEDK